MNAANSEYQKCMTTKTPGPYSCNFDSVNNCYRVIGAEKFGVIARAETLDEASHLVSVLKYRALNPATKAA